MRPPLQLPLGDDDSVEALVIRDLVEDGMLVEAGDRSSNKHSDPTGGCFMVTQATIPVASTGEANVIRLLSRIASPPTVAETAVCLSLIGAMRATRLTSADVLGAIARPVPFVCLRVPLRGFEKVLGMMLEHGALGRSFRLRDGSGNFSLSNRLHSSSEPCERDTAITFRARDLEGAGPDKIRTLMSKAESLARPIIMASEAPGSWPERVSASADLILDAPIMDWSLLARLIEICAGIPHDEVMVAAPRYSIEHRRLDLHDLSLAIKPGRQLPDILSRLQTFAGGHGTVSDDLRSDTGNTETSKTDGGDSAYSSRSEQTTRRGDKRLSTDIIQPVKPAKARPRLKQRQEPWLAVETLAGYGEAREWAMDLKTDLALWRQNKIAWSDMSTKLLLSGPPGTGKTTYARALCNTLQIPLIASSVGHWLEPGYLGDVLKRITATFDLARENAPIILFVDELDGIGRRDAGTGRSYDDYWISVINRTLEMLDGALKSQGIVIVGATNRPDVIDPAIRRSGRLERHIEIPPPDIDALEGIIRHHLGSDADAVLATALCNDDGPITKAQGGAANV